MTGSGPEQIAAAAKRLSDGRLVAFPTETVYGLGADARDAAAVERVFELKGRPATNPLIVHVSGAEMARSVVAAWTEQAQALADEFWPGPLSLVLPRAANLPSVVTAGGATVAVRCPDHPLTLALIEAFGGPIVGPSANPSGAISPTMAAHVRASFAEDEVFVIDGGPCRGGIESTVLSLAGEQPRVLRLGLIGADELSRVLGVEVGQGAADSGAIAESPGLVGPHYTPAARTVLADADGVKALVAAAKGAVAVVAITPGVAPAGAAVVELPGSAAQYAAGLYAALRTADEQGPSLIIVERPPTTADDPRDAAIWAAVHERLARATAG